MKNIYYVQNFKSEDLKGRDHLEDLA